MFSPQAPTANAAARHIQLGMGVLVLSVALLIAVRFWVRQRARVPAPAGNAPGEVPESEGRTRSRRRSPAWEK
ncbi:Protein of uncharacterised function (DUF2910) [Mycolicibacterium fortuitum]|uniref:Protein of uncharacterized function (DUF2910) n=1 Tax=Mycolicibacterium fortuitum TaxID=1766 RepID=A0A378UCF8_MYCFO|nr:Protein of uncharacterised function (DUF2910) [Mycolicibacterium fortuitum]